MPKKRIYIVAEIGINHNGDIGICKDLINAAKSAGCDAIKLQKRSIDKVYSADFLNSPRNSPWGITQRDQKEGLEFNLDQYQEIDQYCKSTMNGSPQLGIKTVKCFYDNLICG